MDERRTPEGDPLYVDTAETERGAKGPFYAAYRTASGDRRYGYVCGNCDSTDVAMDSMGTIVCNACGNRRKPTEWDAAHE